MTDDIDATAEECRRKATLCKKRADANREPVMKAEYEKLAQKWDRKATELENDLA
jgi:hypothetical protein